MKYAVAKFIKKGQYKVNFFLLDKDNVKIPLKFTTKDNKLEIKDGDTIYVQPKVKIKQPTLNKSPSFFEKNLLEYTEDKF